MNHLVDARGLSCPQPVMLTLKEIKKLSGGEVIVLVDTDTAKENVCRAAQSQGWYVKAIDAEAKGYRITLSK